MYLDDIPQADGVGLYTQTLMQNFPHLPVEEEGRLGDPILCENFIQRVFVFKRWQDMVQAGTSSAALTKFHSNHKLVLYSHDQQSARELGRELSGASAEFSDEYLQRMMKILKVVATRANHVNVLEHVRGYLKTELDKEDKQALSETIENYRLGMLPLNVPITLLRHHFRKHPNEYIDRSYYMQPHPTELMLLNTL